MNKTTIHESATINPARALFVKLGFGRSWEKESIEKGILRFGYSETPFEAATSGKWDVVREVWRRLRSDAGAATRDVAQIRSSKYLTEFFMDCDTDYAHDGSTRDAWVAETLRTILAEPQPGPNTPPDTFARVIDRLMDQTDARNEAHDRPGAMAMLAAALARERFEPFYAEDRKCYLRHIATSTIATPQANPHRPFSAAELTRRDQLIAWLDKASEDELIEEVLLPLYRQLGFHRITAAGHKDKALEYGKDVWMKFILPTQHVLYFGIQAKKGKLDAAGMTKTGNANIAEIHSQVLMMLGHEIFDPEIGKRVLVDHAFIVAGGEITKAARNWLGNALDATKRSQMMFMDRDDILNLFVVANIPLPLGALPPATDDDDLPF